jgi:hypothetical protein
MNRCELLATMVLLSCIAASELSTIADTCIRAFTGLLH